MARSSLGVPLLASAIIVSWGACGAREELRGLDLAGDPNDGPGSGAGGDGGTSGSGGSGGEPLPVPDCFYEEPGPPVVPFTHGEGLHSPLLTVLDRGSPEVPARVAYAATHDVGWHPEIRVAQVSVGPSWPDDFEVIQGMTLYGFDAHAPGRMTLGGPDGDMLALLYYHADEASPNVVPGVKFRLMDPSTWQPGADVFVEQNAWFAYDLAAGEGVDSAGAHAGRGFLAAWRGSVDETVVEPRVALLDEAGALLRAPTAASPAAEYPGNGLTVTWTGATYLVGVNDVSCDVEPCDYAVRVRAYDPGTGASEASLVTRATFSSEAGHRPRTPTLVAHGDAAWITWREIAVDDDDAPQIVRIERLDTQGAAIGPSASFVGWPSAGPTLHASDQGTLLVWGELWDSELPEEEVGHSGIVMTQFAKDGTQLQRLTMPITSLAYYGQAYAAASLDWPHGMLLAWAGRSDTGQGRVTFVTRLDCTLSDPN